ncbi:Armadillo-like helical domain containing protein [Gracilaria domingensis]|nr:Armadillo-like helical domain containing protein [Gracilaria domingensis]
MIPYIENDISDLNTSVTKSVRAAIRNLTDGCAVASPQATQAYAYHRLVRVLVLKRNYAELCSIEVMALTAITRNARPGAEKGLVHAKPLPEVLVAMQRHSRNPDFIRVSRDFIEALCNYSSMKTEIVQAGGLPFSADIIRQGGTDNVLLEKACGVIEKLCFDSPENQECCAANKGIEGLSRLRSSHQTISSVMEYGLLAFTGICANKPQNQVDSLKTGCPEVLLRVLTTYSSKNPKVVAASCSAMSTVVVPKNATTAQAFGVLKAFELIVRAMKRHADSFAVQENASAALAAICEAIPKIVSALPKTGPSSVLVVAMQRFLHRQPAVIQIVRAMRAITNEVNEEDSYRFKSKLLTDRSSESSLAEIFHTALSYHKKCLSGTANAIMSICATINRFCMRSVAFKNEIKALQPVLATICTLVLDSEDNKNRFRAVGGVEAILYVMQRWKQDTYVLEHCCAALRYSCNNHFGNFDEVKIHNGVRSILGVTELYPENVNVTLWCCLTLADLCKGDEELQSSPNVIQGIRKVISAMEMFANNSRFLASACEFLRAASMNNPGNQERIVRLGGRTAIVKALKWHPGDKAHGIRGLCVTPDTACQSSSRELRLSGSNASRKGRARKSLSFTGRRSTSEKERNDALVELSQTDGEENPATRGSFLSRNRRKRKSRRNRREFDDEEDDDFEPGGVRDGYGDLDAPRPEPGDDPAARGNRNAPFYLFARFGS